MQSQPWGEQQWEELLYAIEQDTCILMLGPGAICEQVDGQAKPLTEILACELAAGIQNYVDTWHLDPGNLAQISQYYALENGRNALYAKVRAFYAARKQANPEYYQALATLPFSCILTSTSFPFLYESLQQAGKSPIVERYHFRGRNAELVPNWTVNKPLIFYLYGTLEEPPSLVLTENDMLDFLKAVSSQNPPFPWNILSQLRDPDKSFLFLGFRLKQWYSRILIHILQGQKKVNNSFAIEQIAPQNSEELLSTVLFYQKYKIQIHQSSEVESFVKELRKQYEESYFSAGSPKSYTEGPKIFLCHAAEDRDYAAFLADELDALGFRPVFDGKYIPDTEGLNQDIILAIQDCDYFVVLQSQAMVRKVREQPSLIQQQIQIALENQNYYRPGLHFIIPVMIDPCSPLQELEAFALIDISRKENIKELIRIIRNDHQKRMIR